MRYRYVQRLGREDVGQRVSIRRWLDDPELGPVRSDVVGELVAWSDRDVLTVRRRDGSEVEVELADVIAARVVPAPPDRR